MRHALHVRQGVNRQDMTTVERSDETARIEAILGVGKKRRPSILPWLLLISGIAAAVYFYTTRNRETPVNYVTAPAVTGNLTVTVTATGTVFPINQVDISSELSGIIRQVNVDYNERVTKGQVIAELDTVTLTAIVERSRAALAAARARVVQAEATLAERTRNFDRQKALAETRTNTENLVDVAKADFERSRAALESARADVRVAEADLKQNETNLAKSKLYSPVNGVVLKRNVEPGQTVAASFQAPILFTIADDLRRIEVRADIDEADVGKVREGQTASFAVEAFQGKRFPAQIQQIRYASETVNNVVTYKAVLRADNPDMTLRPGMTAICEIVVEEARNVLLIPNAALRFVPPQPKKDKGGGGFTLFRMPRMQPSAPAIDTTTNKRRVYILEGGHPVAREIEIGSSDKRVTRVLSGLEPGVAVITEIEEEAK
jgi:HlyD family secretion protein